VATTPVEIGGAKQVKKNLQRKGGISKRSNQYLRRLLINGASVNLC
jgi:hypothetical protein